MSLLQDDAAEAEYDKLRTAEWLAVDIDQRAVDEIEARILEIRATLPANQIFDVGDPEEMDRNRANGRQYSEAADELDGLYRQLARQQEVLNARIFELGYL